MGSRGRDRITTLKFDKQTEGFTYRRTFARDGDIIISSDISILKDFSNYFDIETVKAEDLQPTKIYPVSGRVSACVDIGD